MKELQRKQKTRRILYSFPSLVVVFIIAVLLARGAVGILAKERESSARLADLKEKSTNLTLREQELKEGVAHLQTEEGVRDEIRDRFSVTEEGEYVAIIVDEKKVSTTTEDVELSWYKKLWDVMILRNVKK